MAKHQAFHRLAAQSERMDGNLHMPGIARPGKNAVKPPPSNRIGIIGGGFSGTATAIHLARMSSVPLDIDVFEPREEPGAGLAYGACAPEHRLNVPADRMVVFRETPRHFADWLRASGEDAADPAGFVADGTHYSRRAVFARYMAGLFRDTAARNPSGSRLRHIRGEAGPIERIADGWTTGDETYAQLVLAVTHSRPALPWPRIVSPAVIEDPWRDNALAAIAPDAEIVIAGSGLTMCDAVMSLREGGHRGPIQVISRRGLEPRPHDGFASSDALSWRAECPQTASLLLHDLRRAIRMEKSRGGNWQGVLNAVRDQLPVFWARLPLAERRRIVRHLRPFWDAHRFRAAPQVTDLLETGRREGWLRINAGRIHALEARDRGRTDVVWTPRCGARGASTADAVINCTGPHPDIARSSHAILRTALASGIIRRDALGLGIDVDADGRAIARDGETASGLWIAGPMARAHMGDATGLPEVSEQTRRVAEALASHLVTDGKPACVT